MVSRTAYAQLRYSPLLLAGTVLGLTLTYLAPVALAIFAGGLAQILGIVVWAADGVGVSAHAAVLWPVDGFGRLALPAIAAMYMAFTRRFRLSACPRPRRHVERPRARRILSKASFGTAMNDAGTR